jgi:FMN phosphatase YigB (HAD superfamily)
MIKAVLLDLDNTLLHNPDNTSVPAYLALVEQHFSQRLGITNMSQPILKSMRAMTSAHALHRSNLELATESIAMSIGKTAEEVQTAFTDFYHDSYPQLSSFAHPLGDFVPLLVEHLRDRGCALVIATNPLYPPEAVRQRLLWAGIPDDFAAYALVTHAGNMHFTKPDPAYFAEIIARVGVEPDEALMVGDNPTNDIAPALQAGLQAFHIVDGGQEASIANKGTLQDFYKLVVDTDWLDTLTSHILKPEMVEPELRGNVGALFGTLADAKPHYWPQHPDPNEWSPIQTVCHLVESENKVQRPRLERIVAEDNPFLVSPPPPPGPQDAAVCEPDGFQAALRFSEERQKTLDWLRTAAQNNPWQRRARHSIFGPTTFLEMAHFTAQHDRLHINQLCQTIGKCK